MPKYSRNQNLKSKVYVDGKPVYFSSVHEKNAYLSMEQTTYNIVGRPIKAGPYVTARMPVIVANEDGLSHGAMLYHTGNYIPVTDVDNQYYPTGGAAYAPVLRALNDKDASGVDRSAITVMGIYDRTKDETRDSAPMNWQDHVSLPHSPTEYETGTDNAIYFVDVVVSGTCEFRYADTYYMYDGCGVAVKETASTSAGHLGWAAHNGYVLNGWRFNLIPENIGTWHSVTFPGATRVAPLMAAPAESAPAGGGVSG